MKGQTGCCYDKKGLTRTGFVLMMAVLSVIFCLPASSGPALDGEARPFTSLDALRHELELAQLLSLPVEGDGVVYDGGEYLFEPDPEDAEALLLLGSLAADDSRGRRRWPVTLREDPARVSLALRLLVPGTDGGAASETVTLKSASEYSSVE